MCIIGLDLEIRSSSVDPRLFVYNYGHLFMYWDWVLGTYRDPRSLAGKQFSKAGHEVLCFSRRVRTCEGVSNFKNSNFAQLLASRASRIAPLCYGAAIPS